MNNILQYPQEINNNSNNSTQLHVWNNAAFDGGDDLSMKTSWSSDCTKENLSPTALNNSSSSQNPLLLHRRFKNRDDDRIIDEEIAEIEGEIKRLTSRLEALRVEKAERRIAAEKRVSVGGRVVAAKFMEPKRNNGSAVSRKKVEERTVLAPKRVVEEEETPKRNVVVSKKKVEEETPKQSGVVSKNARVNWRRGMSLGPGEIAARVAAPATTPARRKSCFWKTMEVCTEERGKTVGSRKSVRKRGEQDDSLVQPRNLFNETEKSVPPVSSSKKGMKPGRVVASRYSQGIGNSGAGSEVRKRALPENNRVGGSEVRVKKRWEIPAEGVTSNAVLLPKIRTLRCVNESPRDSGAAKRVSELTGKRSYFCNDEEEGLCQALSFVEEEDDGEDKVMN